MRETEAEFRTRPGVFRAQDLSRQQFAQRQQESAICWVAWATEIVEDWPDDRSQSEADARFDAAAARTSLASRSGRFSSTSTTHSVSASPSRGRASINRP
jgi:hypothetical protein